METDLKGMIFSYVLIILHVLQAPAVDATGKFPFLKRMADHYNRVPKSATSRQLRDKLRDQGLDKLLEDFRFRADERVQLL